MALLLLRCADHFVGADPHWVVAGEQGDFAACLEVRPLRDGRAKPWASRLPTMRSQMDGTVVSLSSLPETPT
jgi:hypothetical protein